MPCRSPCLGKLALLDSHWAETTDAHQGRVTGVGRLMGFGFLLGEGVKVLTAKPDDLHGGIHMVEGED